MITSLITLITNLSWRKIYYYTSPYIQNTTIQFTIFLISPPLTSMKKVSKKKILSKIWKLHQNLEKQSLKLVFNYTRCFFQLSFSASETLISAHNAYVANSTAFKSITTNLSYEEFAAMHSSNWCCNNVIYGNKWSLKRENLFRAFSFLASIPWMLSWITSILCSKFTKF